MKVVIISDKRSIDFIDNLHGLQLLVV